MKLIQNGKKEMAKKALLANESAICFDASVPLESYCTT